MGKDILAEAGTRLSMLATTARDNNLGGLEFTAGIPGTVGGAVVMNAGANGASIGELVKEVLLLDNEGHLCRRYGTDLIFNYRSTALQRESAIVVEVSFLVYQGKTLESITIIFFASVTLNPRAAQSAVS